MASLLSGCAVTSTLVSSIGARSLGGSAAYPREAGEIDVVLRDSPRVLQSGAVAHFAAIPYSSLSPEGEGQPAGSIVVKPAEVQWSNDTRGQVTVLHAGVPTLFDVRRSTSRGQDWIAVESPYREWYGYPAQGLLVLALPLDVVIDVVAIGGVLVSMPFVYGARLLKGEAKPGVEGASKAPEPQSSPPGY